ncbi:WD40-repeat-containing domain protein [Blastocladiella britannica]|nr:WD40-repeat-containing domain protein [Blastocladiella britannica]
MNASPSASSSAAPAAQPYSLPKVLHFLQSEWRKFDLERNAWELEKAELHGKVAVLDGERRALESIKTDLLKRIRLLEFALRQERAKAGGTQPLGTTGAPRGASPIPGVALDGDDVSVIGSTLSSASFGPKVAMSTKIRHDTSRSRDVLKAYLKEASTLSTSALGRPVVRPALGVDLFDVPDHTSYSQSSTELLSGVNGATNGGVASGGGSAGGGDNAAQRGNVTASQDGQDLAGIQPTLSPSNSQESLRDIVNGGSNGSERKILSRRRKDSLTRNGAATAPAGAPSVTQESQLGGPVSEDDSSARAAAAASSWKLKYTLRHHVDAIRMVDVHPTENVMVSGSEDMTVKLWSLSARKKDLEPYLTLRAHTSPVLAVAFDAQNEFVFSGAADSSLFVWKLTSDRTPYSTYDKRIQLTQFTGHTDAVWDLKSHPTNPLLASCSADQTVKLWDTQLSATPILHSMHFDSTPTSLAFIPGDQKKMAVSTRDGAIHLVDLLTGTIISRLDTGTGAQANRVAAHPTMSLLVSVHEDHSARYTDWSSGTLVHEMRNAHMSSVAAVDFNPSGLSVVTAGHDCSTRVWDVGTRSCVYEVSGHRRRRDEGIWCVRFAALHSASNSSSSAGGQSSQGSVMVTAGADSLAKFYAST